MFLHWHGEMKSFVNSCSHIQKVLSDILNTLRIWLLDIRKAFQICCDSSPYWHEFFLITIFTQIVDISSGQCLSTGQRGELYISGPQIMKGYLKNDDATAACIGEDGFMHTGKALSWKKKIRLVSSQSFFFSHSSSFLIITLHLAYMKSETLQFFNCWVGRERANVQFLKA